MNNRIEQNHRGIKRRYGPTLGFKSFDCAVICYGAVDETRQLFRTRQALKEATSLAACQRGAVMPTEFLQRLAAELGVPAEVLAEALQETQSQREMVAHEYPLL